MAAPLTGNLRLSSGGLTAPLALVYGRESGLRVMRAPKTGQPRVIPISHADRELRVISLGVSPLVVQADISGSQGIQSLGAKGRLIMVFQSEREAGISAGF